MMGAIAGDIIGSVYERRKKWMEERTPHFEPLFARRACFTDDTVLTVAVAESILHGKDLSSLFKHYYAIYPGAGYGSSFRQWAASEDSRPYGSLGNGSAMRVSPVGHAYDSLEEVVLRARMTAEVTHNHPEGIKGAQAVAAAIFLARTGEGKDAIRDYLERAFHYDLSRSLDEIRPGYTFSATCPGSVPEAITAFLESTDYENAVRLAISLGGDADTIACMAGSIAEAFYGGVPQGIREQALQRLDDPLIEILTLFESRYRTEAREG